MCDFETKKDSKDLRAAGNRLQEREREKKKKNAVDFMRDKSKIYDGFNSMRRLRRREFS